MRTPTRINKGSVTEWRLSVTLYRPCRLQHPLVLLLDYQITAATRY
jgi:hypothetical protein